MSCKRLAAKKSEITYIFQIVDSLLESLNLRPAIDSVDHDVSTGIKGSSQDGDSTQFLLRNDLVIPPSHNSSQEWNVHPTAVIGYEHGVFRFLTFCFLKVVGDDLPVLNLRVASSQSHERHTPTVADKDGNSTLDVQIKTKGNWMDALGTELNEEP